MDMVSKILLLVLLLFAFVEANSYHLSATGDLASKSDNTGYDKSKRSGHEYGKSDGKKVSFSNENKNDESATINEVSVNQGPSFSSGGFQPYNPYSGFYPYRGFSSHHGGYNPFQGFGFPSHGHQFGFPSFFQGGTQFSSKKGDVRKSSSGKTSYEASDIKGEQNKKYSEDKDKAFKDAKATSGSINFLHSFG